MYQHKPEKILPAAIKALFAEGDFILFKGVIGLF
jgi:hypothetical protein